MSILTKDSFLYSPLLATEIGLNNAIFLEDIALWLKYNKSENKCYEDGRYWTFSTYEGICKRHPYWTKKQIQKIIKDCKDNGWLIIGNYNKNPYDHTNWYSIGDRLYELCAHIDKSSRVERSDAEDLSTSTLEGESNKYILNNLYKENITELNERKKPKKTSLEIPTQSETGFSDAMQEAFETWLQYKKEKKQNYQPTGLKTFIKKLKSCIEQYGENAVIDMLERTVSSGYAGPVWEWLEKSKSESSKPQKKKRAPDDMPDWNDPSQFFHG